DGGSITGISINGDVTAIAADDSSTVYFGQDGTSQGTTATDAAASLLVNSDGTYTFALLDNLLLDGNNNGEQTEFLSGINNSIVLLGQDNDGDLINNGNGIALTLNVVDDVPTVSDNFATAALTLDEDDLSPDGSDQSGSTSVSGSLFDTANNTGTFTFGADGGSITGISINGDVTAIAADDSSTVYFGQDGTSQGTTATDAAASLL
ncbi:MAG: hypothetical protein GY822_00455, partial [Deltaproteobacteria bacterium]|nr:hypothetical protein [Deltaproteobacteria bacterium]